jgi:EAL domain-containing protein (putative c-di-GMP-specific phosphodiesterase class I)
MLFVDERRPMACALLGDRGFNYCSATSSKVALGSEREDRRRRRGRRDPYDTSGTEFQTVRERFPETVRIVLGSPPWRRLFARSPADTFRFLVKPSTPEEIGAAIQDALRLCHEQRQAITWKEQARMHYRETLRASFERALSRLWIAFQPIVRARDQRLYGYEALLRCADPDLSSPSVLFAVAYDLGRSLDLGRRSRALIALQMERAPPEAVVLVNVHPDQLCDRKLASGQDPLTAHASRIVLKVLEGKALPKLVGSETAIGSLKKLGYRIAADELAAEPSRADDVGLVTPDIMRLEMGLIRDIHTSRENQLLIGSIVAACRAVGISTLAQGVETPEEHDTLVALGCDLMQGFLYGPAAREFVVPAM